MISSIGVEQLCSGLGGTAFVAFLMKLTDKKYSATQFALLSSMMAVTRPFVGLTTGIAAEKLGWSGYFTLSALLAIPGLLLLISFRRDLDR
jgi:PAT family beta-lactamase induction signal transducer AmpG